MDPDLFESMKSPTRGEGPLEGEGSVRARWLARTADEDLVRSKPGNDGIITRDELKAVPPASLLSRLRPLPHYWYESEDGKRRWVPTDEEMKQTDHLGLMDGEFQVQRLRMPMVTDPMTTNQGRLAQGESTFNGADALVLALMLNHGWRLVDACALYGAACERCMTILEEAATGEPYAERATSHTHCELCAQVDPEYDRAYLDKHPDMAIEVVHGAGVLGRWTQRRASMKVRALVEYYTNLDKVLNAWRRGAHPRRGPGETKDGWITLNDKGVVHGTPDDFILTTKHIGQPSQRLTMLFNQILQEHAPGYRTWPWQELMFLLPPEVRWRAGTRTQDILADGWVLDSGDARFVGGKLVNEDVLGLASDLFESMKGERARRRRETHERNRESRIIAEIVVPVLERVKAGGGTEEERRRAISSSARIGARNENPAAAAATLLARPRGGLSAGGPWGPR